MKIKSIILDEFGKPYEINKPQYTLPQSMQENKLVQPRLAQDSNGMDSELPINMWGDSNGFMQVDDIITDFVGWGVLSLVAQNGIVQNIINCISNAATQEWGQLYYDGKDKSAESKMRKMEAKANQLKLRETMRIAHQKTILFGGCVVYAKLAGDDKKLQKEFINQPNQSIRYLKVIEPLYAVPTSFEASNPLSKYFYSPEIWAINGTMTHISRLMHFQANDAPLMLKPVYQFFGISLIQMLLSYLKVFNSMRADIAEIVNRYNINVLKTDISAILEGSTADQDVTSMRTRVELFNKLADNFGVMLLDKEGEEWQQFNMTLTGLDKLVQQNLEYIPVISQIPATKLFGTSPTGFGSSGEHELKTFYDLIRSEQTNKLLPHIEHVFEMIQYELFGDYDPNIKFRFNSLEQQSDLDRSVIFSNYINSIGSLVDRGMITVEESRQFLADKEELEFSSLDTDAEITNLEDDGADNEDTIG